MDDVTIYLAIGIMMFVIGLSTGYLVTGRYYNKRFIQVAKNADKVNSIVPLIAELERES